MATPLRVSMAFKTLNATDQVEFGNTVIAGLTDNALLFPNPPKSLTELEKINADLATDVQNVADTDSKQARSKIKESRAAWINAFGVTAVFVDMIANGSDSIIVAGGYTATKGTRQRKAAPGLASGFKAGTNGVRGSVVATIDKPVPDATALIYYALPPGASVSFSQSTMIISFGEQQVFINAATKRETEIYTLQNKAAFNVGVFAVNSAGIGPSTSTQEVITQ